MAIVRPVLADFTAYNSPGGTWVTGDGAAWNIAMNTAHPADVQFHGYERPWNGLSAVTVWLSATYNRFVGQVRVGFAVRRGSNIVIMMNNYSQFGRGVFSQRWTLPSTFSADTGTTAETNTTTTDSLDYGSPRTVNRISLSGGNLSFAYSAGYPMTDPPFVTKPTTEAVATWLGGDPTSWMVLVQDNGFTTNMYSAISFWGYEEV